MDFKAAPDYKFPDSVIRKIYDAHPLLKPDQLAVGRVYMMVSTHNGKNKYGGPTHMYLCCRGLHSETKYVASLYHGLMFPIKEAERVGYAFRELNEGEKVEFNQ